MQYETLTVTSCTTSTENEYTEEDDISAAQLWELQVDENSQEVADSGKRQTTPISDAEEINYWIGSKVFNNGLLMEDRYKRPGMLFEVYQVDAISTSLATPSSHQGSQKLRKKRTQTPPNPSTPPLPITPPPPRTTSPLTPSSTKRPPNHRIRLQIMTPFPPRHLLARILRPVFPIPDQLLIAIQIPAELIREHVGVFHIGAVDAAGVFGGACATVRRGVDVDAEAGGLAAGVERVAGESGGQGEEGEDEGEGEVHCGGLGWFWGRGAEGWTDRCVFLERLVWRLKLREFWDWREMMFFIPSN
ncbi:hypothetical protein ACLMJK_008243 [Lecanora helva]